VLLSQAAYLLGRDDEFFLFLERAHHAFLASGGSFAQCAAPSGSG
jgi:hypothetical protein